MVVVVVMMVVVVVMMVVDRRLVGDLGGSVSSLSKVPPAKWALHVSSIRVSMSTIRDGVARSHGQLGDCW
jgi:hypothetical protein